MILLIDLSGIYWANWHATKDLEVSEAYERTVSKVTSLRQNAKHVAVCCDAPPYLRKELLPTYKAQRDAPPPQAVEQLDRVKVRLKADGLLIWECRGFEADDVIATAVSRVSGEPIAIASNDKDLLQLVDDKRGVSALSPMTGAEYNEAKVIEKFGVHPAMLGDFLALTGDASDNVPGIPGVGPKTAAKLLLEFGTLEAVLTHGDDMTEKLGSAVKDHAPAARLARKVVTLRTDVPIDVAELYKERKAEKLADDGLSEEDEDAMLPKVAGMAEPDGEPEKKDALATRPQSTTIATLATAEFEQGLEPSTLDSAWQLARGMHNSRMYTKFPTAQACWAVIIRGREMGLGALTALDCFHVVEGKPALHAHLIVARAKAHPDCEFFQLVSSDGEHAEYITKRKSNPEPTRMRYTLEQAKVAGLCPEKPRLRNPTPGEKDRRGNWEKRPEEMLRKTCAVQLARVEYPEAALGLYAIEELEE